jgi:hypothetical protein
MRLRSASGCATGYAHPASACWHSALSPVLASLDLFDPSYTTGQEVQTELCLINDSWHDAAIQVDLLLTKESPEFVPEAACLERPVAAWNHAFTLPADTLKRLPITWKLPETEGSYWLTARTTGLAGRPVLSQRFVRAVRPPEVSQALRNRRLVVLGGDAAADGWFRSRDLEVDHDLTNLAPEKCVVVIWNAAELTPAEKAQASTLRQFASAGGRIVVLATRSWDWTELCDIQIGKTGGSRAFPYPNTNHSMLAGLSSDWLSRWNGLPGTVVAGTLEGPALAGARKILWVREPKNCVAAEVPLKGGKGAILFSQLELPRHATRAKPNYDPVAEAVPCSTEAESELQESLLFEKDRSQAGVSQDIRHARFRTLRRPGRADRN